MLNKLLYVFIASLLIISCTTEKRATKYFDKHEEKAIKYLKKKYPVRQTSDTTYNIDSTSYLEAYTQMWQYADSLLRVIETAPNDSVAVYYDTLYIPNAKADKKLREQIEKEIRKRLRPCLDSVMRIKETVIDTLTIREKELIIEKKDKAISSLSSVIEKQSDKINQLQKYKILFWVLVIALLLWITRAFWKPLLFKL